MSAVSPPSSAQPGAAQASATPLTSATFASGGQVGAGDVVEEEERLGAGGQQVVDAAGDDVVAERLVRPGQRRELDLGADAVRAGDEHRVVVLRPQREQPGERPDAAEHLRAPRLLRDVAIALDDAFTRVEVDAGGGVGQRRGLWACHG